MPDDSVESTVKGMARLNRWLLALFVALLAFGVAESVILYSTLTSRDDGPREVLVYEVQTVANRLDGIEVPALQINDDGTLDPLNVEATKCNNSEDGSRVVTTSVSFDTVEPRGTIVEDWVGTQEIEQGCETYTFTNPVPDLVASRTLELIERFPTLECIEWAIVGVDSPLNPQYLPERWKTEPFCVYPPE